MGMPKTTTQFVATAIANILSFSHGCGLGWSSPAVPYFGGPETHLKSGPASASDLSWIGSAISIGALVATIFSGSISECIGRKKTLMLLALPNLTFWVLVYLATESYQIIIARSIAGLTGGGIFRLLTLFIADISENHVRGGLSSIFPFSMNSGILVMFIMGAYMDYFTVPLIIIVFPVAAFILLIFLPDTPQFLIEKKRYEEGVEALKFYRGCNSNSDAETVKKVENEFESLKKAIEMTKATKVTMQDFNTKASKIGLALGFFLVFLLTFSGNAVLMMYTAYIFSRTGSPLSPDESSIVVAAVQILGIFMMGILVDKLGRKNLMIFSCTLSCFFQISLAVYMVIKEGGKNMDGHESIPLIAMVFIIFTQALGISSLPFVMLPELVPYKIWEVATLFCMIIVAIFMFITLKVFPAAVESVGLSSCFFFFGAVCLIGIIISTLFLKETKGKDLFDQ